MIDLESNIQVLRTFKNMYKSAAEYKCSGCLRTFAPVLFKAHIQTCSKLVSITDRQVDDRLFIKAVEKTENSLRFYCSGYGLEWNVTKGISEFKEMVEGIQKKYPKVQGMQENWVKRCLLTVGENGAEEEEVMRVVNKTITETLCTIYVVKTDRMFREFFEIDE